MCGERCGIIKGLIGLWSSNPQMASYLLLIWPKRYKSAFSLQVKSFKGGV